MSTLLNRRRSYAVPFFLVFSRCFPSFLFSCSKDPPLKPSEPPTLTDPSGKIVALPVAAMEPDPSDMSLAADDPTWHTFQIHTDAESLRVRVNPDGADVVLELATGHRPPISSYCPGEPNDEKKRKASIRNGYQIHLQICGEGQGEIVLEEYVYDHPLQRYSLQVSAPVDPYGPGSVEGDRAALVAFMEGMGERAQRQLGERSWGSRSTLAKWYGVKVNDQGRVIELDLSRENRKTRDRWAGEPLFSALARLDQLQRLDLTYVYFQGQLPPEWGRLTNLEELNLGWTSLRGPIPEAWGAMASLRHLDLLRTNLNSPIPEALGQLSNLEYLDLEQSGLTGSIPPELGRLTKLEELNVAYNPLTGPIPPELGQLTNLKRFRIRNGLTEDERTRWPGGVPEDEPLAGQFQLFPELTQLTNLERLELYPVEGTLPAQWAQLAKLETLSVGGPYLEGSLPEEWSALTRLEVFEVVKLEGYLTGPLPASWSQLVNLKAVWLTDQELTGPLPASWGQLSNLEKLHLNGNILSGPIPPEWGQMLALRELLLHHNPLGGEIPVELGQLYNLKKLYLSGCELTGSIPSSLGQLHQLTYLYLNDNELTGEIPHALACLSQLIFLSLSNNRLTGRIPIGLGHLSSLIGMWLNGNEGLECANLPPVLQDFFPCL